MIEPTMIHAGAMPPHLQLGWGRDMIFPPPCHFGKQAIMIYDDSFSSVGLSFCDKRNNSAHSTHSRQRRAAVRATVTWI